MSTMHTVYSNLRAARSAIKDVGRLREIVTVMVRHGLGHVVEAWDLQDKFLVGLVIEKRPADQEKTTVYERITEALQDLGPTFVKLGQILSTRPDLIPQELCSELGRLQDDVAPIALADARRVVEDELERPIEEVFDDFSEAPLACASIAQVHTARLKTGEAVVVKVRRPGIKRTIESDLHILYFVARQLESTIPELKAFDPVSIAKEFEKAIRRELDFRFEADHLLRFDRNFDGWGSIYIPRLYKEVSGESVMVIERLHGYKITEAAEHGFNMEPIARETIRALFKMAFEDGFFHGDLHPGNIFIMEGGIEGARIGLIDFGLVGRMTAAMKDAMADLLLAIVTRNYSALARCLYDISIRTTKVNFDAFEADTTELAEKYLVGRTLAEVDFGAMLRDIIGGAIRHNVRVPPDYTMFFKAVMTIEGIGKSVAPDLDVVSECRPYVEKLVAERYSPERVLRSVVDTLQAFGRLGKLLPITATEFLRQIEDGRLSLGVEHMQLDRLESARDRRHNRAVLTALSVALLVCGTLMRHDASFQVFGLPGFATLAWFAGAGLGLRIFWRVYRSGRW